jgi:hypothetical protein
MVSRAFLGTGCSRCVRCSSPTCPAATYSKGYTGEERWRKAFVIAWARGNAERTSALGECSEPHGRGVSAARNVGAFMKEWTFVRCAELHDHDQIQTSVIVVNGGFPPSPSWGWRHVSTGGLAKVR